MNVEIMAEKHISVFSINVKAGHERGKAQMKAWRGE